MHDGGRADQLVAFVALGFAVQMLEEPLSASEQDGDDGQVHLVDQFGPWILLDAGNATAVPDVTFVGDVQRSLGCRLHAVLDEVERGPTLHPLQFAAGACGMADRLVDDLGSVPRRPPPSTARGRARTLTLRLMRLANATV